METKHLLLDNSSFEEQNKSDWKMILTKIFPSGIPKHAEWDAAESISNVLATIGEVSDSNHTFYSSVGGDDLRSSKLASEEMCLELDMGSAIIVKPKRLLFEGLDKNDMQWNYFWFELDELPVIELQDSSTDESIDTNAIEQMVVELTSGEYISVNEWEDMQYEDHSLNQEDGRIIQRALSGVYVIFAKSSWYNNDFDYAYQGIQAKMNAEEFKKFIEQLRDRFLLSEG